MFSPLISTDAQGDRENVNRQDWFVYCDNVFGAEEKRFFVLEGSRRLISYYKCMKDGVPSKLEGTLEITDDCAITAHHARLIVVSRLSWQILWQC